MIMDSQEFNVRLQYTGTAAPSFFPVPPDFALPETFDVSSPESAVPSRYQPPPNPPKNWDVRKSNVNPDHGFGVSLEPREFLYGFPEGVHVSDVYEKDGKVVMAGSGIVSGKSLVKPVSFDYHYLQRTELPVHGGESFVRLPAAEFKIGLQFDVVKADVFHYELAVDKEEFINGLSEAAAANGEELSADAGTDIPQWDGGTDPEEMDEYLNEYQTWVNDYLGEKFDGLLALLLALFAEEIEGMAPGDYVELEKKEEEVFLYKFDLPLSASIGTWDYADGGEFFRGRVGFLEAIRLGGRVSGTLVFGDNIKLKPYVGFGLFLDVSLLSLYYWDHKYPGSYDFGVRVSQDIYTDFGDSNLGASSLGTYLRLRF
ncbi:MAG: hypothetical protein HY541_06785 [Deltaproteobacteria bacterium]|nr:hypothetical protein [Deltaproteobacteria bacterium]